MSDATHHRASLSKHYILIAARFNNSVIESRSALCHKDRSHKLWQLKPVINIKVQIGRAVISAFNDWKWQEKATTKAFLIMQFMPLGTAHFLASSTGPNKWPQCCMKVPLEMLPLSSNIQLSLPLHLNGCAPELVLQCCSHYKVESGTDNLAHAQTHSVTSHFLPRVQLVQKFID